jgi:hypothetical protein
MTRRKERKFFVRLCSFTTVMKEIPKRKTVTSSLDEISTDQLEFLENRVVVRGGGISIPLSFYSRLL